MPKGNPKAQTIASDKYQKKNGIIVKGFKMNRELAEKFRVTCEQRGVSQASVISEYMKRFIEENKSKTEE